MSLLSVQQLLQSSPPPSSTAQFPQFQGLKKCSTISEVRQFHSQIIRLGASSDNHAMGRLLKLCVGPQIGDLHYALQLFDTIPEPDTFIYNTLMKALLQFQEPAHCVVLYCHMLQHSLLLNNFTFPSVIRACCLLHDVHGGRQVHAHVFKFGFGAHICCVNNLIHMYLHFQALEDARRVFDYSPEKDSISWTTLISGYSKRGFVDEAFGVFQMMPKTNSTSWNSMIAAYVQNNQFHQAFALFDRMKAEKVGLDKFMASSMLSACIGLGALEQGKWIHAYIERNGIHIDAKLAATIIDMYCKCGSLQRALDFFNKLPCKGISSWNCMIGGLALHGKGEIAIEIFKQMEKEMVAPDNITFVNLLGACAHSGLVEEGRHYFRYMVETHGIEPTMEHFGCMVDLLGRAGMLKEARKLVDKMPMSPDAAILGALMGACKKYRNIELGEEIGKRVIELEPHNSGRYVLLANLYADVGRWEDVANIRKLMNDRGVKKAPGFSVIEVGGAVNEFTANGMTHSQAKEIYATVDEMLEFIKSIGYVPDTNEVLHDLDKEERESPLYCHSEKLAIAFGLLRSKPGEILRISKNLRICKDCHEASKFISEAYDREIIIRDRSRFHHFRRGKCSCKEYW